MDTATDDIALTSRYHHPSRRADLRERRRQEHQLADALKADLLAVSVTPRFTLSGLTHVADEIAPRWHQATRAASTAAAAVATTADAALARDLTNWLLHAACTARADRSRITSLLLPDALPRDAALVADVARAIRRSHRPADRLELRFSEAALHGISTEALLCLAALKDLDVRLAIDDFGRRVGSLASLRHLPLSAIRLDPSLTHDLPTDTTDRTVVEGLVGMSRSLGIDVIALAVDSTEHCTLLSRLGITEGVGRLAPMGPELPEAA